ncbi:MAG TPA: hypothetical protein VNT75_33275 [Symbiobacteriaceae bacterium]|nr:hypothetical protein [Symbiobacteriaceae bacterium]
MMLPAQDVLCYWPADREIEADALGLLEPSEQLPAQLQALYQKSYHQELAFLGRAPTPLPDSIGEIRAALQTSGEAIQKAGWLAFDLVEEFVRRRARLFVHLRAAGKTPPLVVPYTVAATTPAGTWPAERPVRDLFPLFAAGHAAAARLWEQTGPDLLRIPAAANHFLHALIWEEFLTTVVTGDPPVRSIQPAWFRLGVDAHAANVAMADPKATLAEVSAHTADMLGQLRAADLTRRQAYRGITFHHTLWYAQWHALHHVTEAEAYYAESHQLA